jgi:hypothetical protein
MGAFEGVMLRIEKVARQWADHKRGEAEHLSSDGLSLWSYGYYEIVRHVGSGAVLIRNSCESYSNTTARHRWLGEYEAQKEGLAILYACGDSASDRDILGQPDWSWASLAVWFDASWEHYRHYSRWRQLLDWKDKLAGGRDEFHVRLRKGLKFRGNELLCALRNQGVSFRLNCLCLDQVGYGVALFHGAIVEAKAKLDCGVVVPHHERVRMPEVKKVLDLDWLERVSPVPRPSYATALEHRQTGPTWRNRLFPEWDIPDIRESDIWGKAAFKGTAPPFVLSLDGQDNGSSDGETS